jgi:cytochrome c peroxidase
LKGFADGRKVAKGIKDRLGERNTPTIINAAYNLAQFWDGRAGSLEEQALGSIANPKEMSLEATTEDAYAACVRRLAAIPEYQRRFRNVFGQERITIRHVVAAIADFERTVLSGDSPYDRYIAGDRTAMTPAQIRGMEAFTYAGCDGCHRGVHFTDGAFIMSGVGAGRVPKDPGRFSVTRFPQDFGAFRTSTLRDIVATAPYMHDGSIPTLAKVVEHYDKGVKGEHTELDDRLMAPKHLTSQQRTDLVEFLKALSGSGWRQIGRPELPKAVFAVRR